MSIRNVVTGTTPGTYAAGDDSRFAQIATNTTNIAANTANITSNATAITNASTSLAKLSLTPTATKTGAYTAAAQDLVLADATSGAFNVTLPVSPADGSQVAVKKIDSTAGVITVFPGGSATFSTGGASAAIALAGQTITWRYQASTSKWIGIGNDLPLSATDTRYMIQGGTLAAVYVYSSYSAAPALPANSVVISISGA